MPGMEPMSAMCKANALPTGLWLSTTLYFSVTRNSNLSFFFCFFLFIYFYGGKGELLLAVLRPIVFGGH